MKKLSEVCKITGVTRRTLQEYDRIGLLKPTARTEAGYWLYDTEAINKLIFIQVFVELGYKRKTIKDIFDGPEKTILIELQRAVEELENKKKRIDGMIEMVKATLVPMELPMATLTAFASRDPSWVQDIYQNSSFKNEWDLFVDGAANLSDEERRQFRDSIQMLYYLMAIGNYMDKDPSDEAVRECVEEFVEFTKDLARKYPDEDTTDAEIESVAFIHEIYDFISDDIATGKGLMETVDRQVRPGASQFILNALMAYIKYRLR